MNRFFNQLENVVTEAIDGTLRLAGAKNIARANGFPHKKFVARTDRDKSKVAIISGGGAGHEPAHIGFVGKGMLTAAVSGEVFASPSTEAVLACIMHVTEEAGCLLIVTNYTGDRLNFGLAAERAKKLGKKVEMVIVADDIALPDAPQPRGIAGTLFVHKIAGYWSEAGATLEEIKLKATAAAQNCYSLGIASSTCTTPGNKIETTNSKAELGLGIHGEPGIESISFDYGKEAVDMVLARLFKSAEAEAEYALLINNLGAVTPLEMSIITNEILTSDYKHKIKLVLGPALFMTSLNMYGFSLSIIKLNDEIETILKAPVEPYLWPGIAVPVEPSIFEINENTDRLIYKGSENTEVHLLLKKICEAIIQAERNLNELDKKVGDGDTGTTLSAGANALLKLLNQNKLPLNNKAELLLVAGEVLADSMGGSSGVLSSIFLTNAGTTMLAGANIADALESGIKMIMQYGGASLGSRTMIDALYPAIEALKNSSMNEAAAAAREGANKTTGMTKANAGRSSYLRKESLIGVTDPGAEAVAIIFESLVK